MYASNLELLRHIQAFISFERLQIIYPTYPYKHCIFDPK